MGDNYDPYRFDFNIFDDHDGVSDNVLLNSAMKVIGYFSVNENGEYIPDARNLKYVYHTVSNGEESVEIDLNYKLDSITKKLEYKTWNKLNHMFTWVSLNCAKLFPINNLPFVTFRGNISTILNTPYESNDDWTICAKVCDGIIYLNSFDTLKKCENVARITSYEKRCQKWGVKFEQFMVSDSPQSRPNPDAEINHNEEFCCVFERNIGRHRLIYGAEMDGVLSDEVINLENKELVNGDLEFVELKTTRLVRNFKNDVMFRRNKIMKWWTQSYLGGIKYIICGNRDKNGIIKTLKRYKVSELPVLGSDYWDSKVCLNFCNRFLNFVKRIILESSSNDDVWKFDCIPMEKIIASRVTDSGSIYKSDFKEIRIHEIQ